MRTGLGTTTKSKATLLIVIVNYRSAGLAEDCVASLEPELARLVERGCSARVTVVENASGEVCELREMMAQHGWGNWCEVMELAENRGFAAGNNAAIEPLFESGEAKPDYVWLLNPDTVVREGALSELLAFMEEHPDVGICGSRLEDPDETVQRSAFRFPSVLGEFESAVKTGVFTRLLSGSVVAMPPPREASRCGWVSGASMLVRREVFEQIRLLDEGYFMYYEEVDFCKRAAEAGWSCWYVPASRVVHLVGQSSGVTGKQDVVKRRPGYWFASRRRYFVKHHGRWTSALADAALLTGNLLFRLRCALSRRQSMLPPRFELDLLRASVARPGKRSSAG